MKRQLASPSLAGAVGALALCLAATPAFAGPPFLTDDPEPTDTGHWEIYAPLFEGEGTGGNLEGATGAEINYGAAPGVQLSIDLPIAYRHDSEGWHSGVGDLALSAKYRFYNNEHAGLSVAIFPSISLPSGSRGLGAGRVTAFLPVWAQKNAGDWSVFGGGGYAINPGPDSRNYWKGGIAVTRKLGERLIVGAEAARQGADAIDGSASTSLGVGMIYLLKKPLKLLASGGPTFEDRGGKPGFHVFFALGLDY